MCNLKKTKTFLLSAGLIVCGSFLQHKSKYYFSNDWNSYRSISSLPADEVVEEELALSEEEKLLNQEIELAKICENDQKISSLLDDVNKIKAERTRILAAIEKVVADEEEKEKFRDNSEKEDDRSKKKDQEEEPSIDATALAQVMMASMIPNMMAQTQMQIQSQMAAPIVDSYNPFGQMSQNHMSSYMQMVMAHRMAFSAKSDMFWHPEFSLDGSMTNPLYGGSNTWDQISTMYRDPMGNQKNYGYMPYYSDFSSQGQNPYEQGFSNFVGF